LADPLNGQIQEISEVGSIQCHLRRSAAPAGGSPCQSDNGREHKAFFLSALRGILGRIIDAGRSQREQLSNKEHVLGNIGVRGNQGFNLVEFRLNGVACSNPASRSKPEMTRIAAVLTVWRAKILENSLGVVLKPIDEGRDKMRLAHTCITREQDYTA